MIKYKVLPLGCAKDKLEVTAPRTDATVVMIRPMACGDGRVVGPLGSEADFSGSILD